MEKTTNYQLNKPEAGDPLRVADFNENADIIDAVLGNLGVSVPKIAIGSYVGTDASGSSNPNILTFDFAPQALFVWGNYDHAQGVRDQKVYVHLDGTSHRCTTMWNGNTVQWYAGLPAYQMNNAEETYCYLAIG